MIKHLVMFKLLPTLVADEKEAVKQELRQRLEALPAKIAEIRSFEVGLNTLESDRSMDIVLISTFDTMADLSAYAIHPDHMDVVAYVRTVCEKTVSCDFPF